MRVVTDCFVFVLGLSVAWKINSLKIKEWNLDDTRIVHVAIGRKIRKSDGLALLWLWEICKVVVLISLLNELRYTLFLSKPKLQMLS